MMFLMLVIIFAPTHLLWSSSCFEAPGMVAHITIPEHRGSATNTFISCAYALYSWLFGTIKQKNPSQWTSKEWHQYFKKQHHNASPEQLRKTMLEYWPGYFFPAFCTLIAPYQELTAYLQQFSILHQPHALGIYNDATFIVHQINLPGFASYFCSLSQEQQREFCYRITALERDVARINQKKEKRAHKKKKQLSPKIQDSVMHTAQFTAGHATQQNPPAQQQKHTPNPARLTRLAWDKQHASMLAQEYAYQPLCAPEHIHMQRTQQLHNFLNQEETFSTQQHTLSPAASTLLEHFELCPQRFMQSEGCAMQHALHREALHLLEQVARDASEQTNILQEQMIDFIHASCLYAQEGLISTSCRALDVSWALYACAQQHAKQESCQQDNQLSLEQLMANPVKILTQHHNGMLEAAQALAAFAHHAGVTDILLTEEIKNAQPPKTLADFIAQLSQMSMALATYAAEHPTDALKEGAVLIIEALLAHKACVILQKLFAHASKHAAAYFKKLEEALELEPDEQATALVITMSNVLKDISSQNLKP